MRPIVPISAVAVFFVVAPNPCFALWEIAPVSRERAKEMSMEVRSNAASPNQVTVELEFKPEGALKNFSRVDLRVGEGDNPVVTAPLREDRSKPGRVVVSFTADRTQIDKLKLWVFVPESLGGTIYDLRVKDFLQEEKFAFPYFLPDSRIVIGEELVDEVNALDSKEEQIQFLIKILPPTDQEKKHLSDRQLYAIRLLSLTASDAVIDPLMNRFDFVHKGDGWPVVHAMARLGERSVEPLLERLQQVASDRQKTAACGAALIEMKMKQFPMFIDELKRRKDIKLSVEVLNELLDQYRFAPD